MGSNGLYVSDDYFFRVVIHLFTQQIFIKQLLCVSMGDTVMNKTEAFPAYVSLGLLGLKDKKKGGGRQKT